MISPKPPNLGAALRYAERGIRVLPLHTPQGNGCSCGKPDCPSPGKHPRTPNGVKDATTDPDAIRHWWTKWPDANIGLATGAESDIVVVDADGDAGLESLQTLRLLYDLNRVPEVLTGSGGRHLYFRHPGGTFKNRVKFSSAYPGLDTRGDGGYVVAPPSLHASGVRYSWLEGEGSKPPPFPRGFTEIFEEPAEESHNGSSDLDLLLKPSSVPKGTRNDFLTREAGRLVRAGYRGGRLLGVLTAMNEYACVPPLPPREVEAIVQSSRDWDGGAGDFDEIPPEVLEQFTNPKSLLELPDPEPPAFIIRELLPDGHYIVVYGGSGVGKSTLGLLVALEVALGEGTTFEVDDSGPILWISEEDDYGVFRNRIEALCEGMRYPKDKVLSRIFPLTHTGLRLDNPNWVDRLNETVENVDPKVIILDPWSDFFTGEENSNDVARALRRVLRRLAQAGRAVVVVHHEGKNSEATGMARARGAGALLDGARAAFRVSASKTAQARQLGIHITCTKMSRAAKPDPFELRFTISEDPLAPGTWTSATVERMGHRELEDEQRNILADEVVEFVRECGPCSAGEIEEGVEGRTEDIRAGRRLAVRQGRLEAC